MATCILQTRLQYTHKPVLMGQKTASYLSTLC